MKEVYVCRGLPGSGKSTWARENFPKSNIVSADDFFTHGDEYKFDPKKIPQAHQSCFRKFIRMIDRGVSPIIVDNTNTQLWEMSPYILAGESFGYTVKIFEFHVPVKLSSVMNVHGVPESTIKRMKSGWQEALPWWDTTKIRDLK